MRRPMAQHRRRCTRPAPRPSSAPPSRPAPTGRTALTHRARHDLRPSQRRALRLASQLIQRLVTSNPSPGLCARASPRCSPTTAAACAATSARWCARSCSTPRRAATPSPRPRVRQAARADAAPRRLGARLQRHLADRRLGDRRHLRPVTRLGQSPLRSPSVFNFFRPGYVPPNTRDRRAGLVAPEFQITNEPSVVGYVNYMQRVDRQRRRRYQAPTTRDCSRSPTTRRRWSTRSTSLLGAGQLSAATATTHRRRGRDDPGGTDAGAPATASTPRCCWRWPRPNIWCRSEEHAMTTQRFPPRLPAARRRARRLAGAAAPLALNLAAIGEAAAATRQRLQGAGLRLPVRRQRLRQHADPLRRRRATPPTRRCAPTLAYAARRRSPRPRSRPTRRAARRPPVCAGAASWRRCMPLFDAGKLARDAQRRHAGAADHQGAVHRQERAAAAQAVLAQRPAVGLAGVGARRRDLGLGRAHRRPVPVRQRQRHLHLHQRLRQRGVPVGQHRRPVPGHDHRPGAAAQRRGAPLFGSRGLLDRAARADHRRRARICSRTNTCRVTSALDRAPAQR